jgi:hypothetical protein
VELHSVYLLFCGNFIPQQPKEKQTDDSRLSANAPSSCMWALDEVMQSIFYLKKGFQKALHLWLNS